MYLVHQLCNLRDEEERSIHCDTHIIQTLLIHQLGYLIRVFLVGFFMSLYRFPFTPLPIDICAFFTFVQKQIECDRAEATIPVYMECFSN